MTSIGRYVNTEWLQLSETSRANDSPKQHEQNNDYKGELESPDNLSVPFYPESFGMQLCHHSCIGIT